MRNFLLKLLVGAGDENIGDAASPTREKNPGPYTYVCSDMCASGRKYQLNK